MNAWRESLARVAAELWLAIFTHDTALIRYTWRRIRGRLGLRRERYADGTKEHPLVIAAAFVLIPVFFGLLVITAAAGRIA